jgi:hypothetical protein
MTRLVMVVSSLDPPSLHEAAVRFAPAVLDGSITFAEALDHLFRAASNNKTCPAMPMSAFENLCSRLADTLTIAVEAPALAASQKVRDTIRPMLANRRPRATVLLAAYRAGGDDLLSAESRQSHRRKLVCFSKRRAALPYSATNPWSRLEPSDTPPKEWDDIPLEESISVPPPIKPLQLIWARDIEPVVDAQGTLVADMLDTSAMSVVYGASNAGKTFFSLDLSFHIAVGMPWFGREITMPGCVVYLAAEGGRGMLNRVAALKMHYGVTDIPLAVIASPIDLLDPLADLPLLLDRIKEAATTTGLLCVMVVIDTLSRAMVGGDENGSSDMTGFIGNIDRLRHAGPHLQVIHHCGKDEAKGARGHSSLRAATDTEIELKVTNQNDRTAVAYVRKQRDMLGGDEIAFRLKGIILGETPKGKSVTSCVVEPMLAHLVSPQRREPS